MIDSLIGIFGLIECNGELSCFSSTIYSDGNSDVRCRGARSCAQTTIYAVAGEHSEYSFGGHLSAQDSLIYSMNNNVELSFSGRAAGDGAEIIFSIKSHLSYNMRQ